MQKMFAFAMVAFLAAGCATQQPTTAPVSGAAKRTASVDFSTDSGRPVVLATVNGQELPVVFDTGSQGTVIPKSLAELLRLEVVGEAMIGSPYGGAPTTAPLVSLVSLSIGGVQAVQLDAVVIDDSKLPPNDLRLVVGPNLFADRAVEFDFATRTMRLMAEIPGEAAAWQRMDGRGMLKTLLVIGQETVAVTLDTGNPGGINLPTSIANKLGIALTPLTGRKIKTVDAEFQLYQGVVDADATLAGVPLRLGTILFADIPSANAGVETLNGMRLMVDTPRRRWRLEPVGS